MEPGHINPNVLKKLLDDNEDGQEQPGLLDDILVAASRQVDGYLARYAPPLSNPTAFVKAATLLFAGYEIYRRKGMESAPKNPFANDRDRMIKTLEAIQNGELDLAGVTVPGGKAYADVAPAATHLQSGGMMF